MAPQKLIAVCLLATLAACSTTEKKTTNTNSHFTQYSSFVKDTFYVDIQVPDEYAKNPNKKYPTLILLDGNFYFPMISPITRQYETAALLDPFIVVGIGYKSMKLMDSLRVRDYLFPKSLPSDELNAIGGGENFYHYITKELLPKIDEEFRTEKDDRTLVGHSFGGYFVLYSLLMQSKESAQDFKYFVSASPTLWYNDFYLNTLPQQLSENNSSVGLFLAVGALEDSTWSVNPVKNLSAAIQNKKLSQVNFKSRIYNHLDHMDVPIITFIKGIQEMRSRE